MKPSISVVIPVFNSEEIIPELINRLSKALVLISQNYEIALVNDGSEDDSWRVIQNFSKGNSHIKGINLMRNYGQHNALLCGIRASKYEVIVTMDDDLQHPPEEINLLINKLSEGFDVVYGIPNKLVHAPWRNLSSKLTKLFLAKILGMKRIKYMSAFRAFRSDIRRSFENFDSPNVIIDALLTWGTDNFGLVMVEEEPRQIGRSNYNLLKLIKVAMIVLTDFSTVPLRFASILGFILTIFGIGILGYVLVRTFSEGSIPGFPFLASIISIFSGAQLFSLGVFGEYLARIFHRSMNHPAYVIGESTEPIK
jgi:glycosyltransferase involved in cell wall biosynthesis